MSAELTGVIVAAVVGLTALFGAAVAWLNAHRAKLAEPPPAAIEAGGGVARVDSTGRFFLASGSVPTDGETLGHVLRLRDEVAEARRDLGVMDRTLANVVHQIDQVEALARGTATRRQVEELAEEGRRQRRRLTSDVGDLRRRVDDTEKE